MVSADEMAVAAAIVATINRVAESNFGVGPHLTAIVGRVRERPSMDASKHVRLIESAFRLKWWERMGRSRGRATPAVIYGNSRVFEQVIQDAVDEANGKSREAAPRRGRFDRKVTRDGD